MPTKTELSNEQGLGDHRPVRKFWWWLLRSVKICLGLVGGYLLLCLVGMIPVNRDFIETDDGIEIFIDSNSVHADLIVPVSNGVINWNEKLPQNSFAKPNGSASSVAFGWGDRGFYAETPTWSDLKVSTVGTALLWPSETVVHVSQVYQPVVGEHCKSVKISELQYRELVGFIEASFARDGSGNVQVIPGAGYGNSDAFFVGLGRYHCFRTCNCWAGNGIKAAGIKTGWFTPLPHTVYWYFPTGEH